MNIVATLITCGVQPFIAKQFAEPLAEAFERFNINTPNRIGGFLGQTIVESAAFTRLEENLMYTTEWRIRQVFAAKLKATGRDPSEFVRNPKALANWAYADKLGNGDEASGDGWRYRGRGIIQLTGRSNYSAADRGVGRPYIAQPELVATAHDSCLTAAWFWHVNRLNALADAAKWNDITRKVNGRAMLEATRRAAISALAARHLSE